LRLPALAAMGSCAGVGTAVDDRPFANQDGVAEAEAEAAVAAAASPLQAQMNESTLLQQHYQVQTYLSACIDSARLAYRPALK